MSALGPRRPRITNRIKTFNPRNIFFNRKRLLTTFATLANTRKVRYIATDFHVVFLTVTKIH